MEAAVLILHVLTAISVIGLVLLQHGKGADMGAAFGSGSAGSLFGASGSANFLSRSTAIVATVFFLTSMGLTYLSFEKASPHGVMSNVKEQPPQPSPAVPSPSSGVPQAAGQSPEDSKANQIPK